MKSIKGTKGENGNGVLFEDSSFSYARPEKAGIARLMDGKEEKQNTHSFTITKSHGQILHPGVSIKKRKNRDKHPHNLAFWSAQNIGPEQKTVYRDKRLPAGNTGLFKNTPVRCQLNA